MRLFFILGLLTPLLGQTIRTGYRDDFATADGWAGNNPKAPAELRVDDGRLILIDPPGGEVTWGTSIAKDLGPIDLSATPWLVVKLDEVSAGFQAKLIDRTNNRKSDGFATAREPGLVVAHVPTITGFDGSLDLQLYLYVQGTEHRIAVDWLKFVSALTPTERASVPPSFNFRKSLPHQGLTALADRRAWRPLSRFTVDGRLLSERVAYTDTSTGNQIWRMTVDPAVDKVAYYDLPEWSADGAYLMFETRRSESRLWVMNADGTGIRPLFSESEENEDGSANGYWSVRYPDLWYRRKVDDAGTAVEQFNVRTGETKELARTTRQGLSLFPPHPAEDHFLLARNAKTPEEDCEVIILGRDGSEVEVPIGGRFHRLRFAKGDTLRIFYNRDDPRTQWVMMPDGSARTELPDPGGHPDWTLDGRYLTYFAEGGVYRNTAKGDARERVFATGAGGHGGPSSDGRWFVADQGAGGDFPNAILVAPLDGSGFVNRLADHGSRMMSHTDASKAHPDHHSTHPHPSFSPDGTKAVFASYADRAFVDIHVGIVRYPDPPSQAEATRQGREVRLSWSLPEQHRELAGYAVYRAEQSGGPYRQVHDGLLTERVFTETLPSDAPAYYTVAAVEHSGLTSRPTAEVCAAPDGAWHGAYRRYVEAETGSFAAPVRLWLESSRQSNAYSVKLDSGTSGRVTMKLAPPVAGEAATWLRTEGPGRVAVDGFGELDVPEGWHWIRAGVAPAGDTVNVDFRDTTVKLDQVLVTNDLEFVPTDRARLHTIPPAPPADVAAKPLDAFGAEVTWADAAEPGVAYYNVYAVASPDAYGSQATLVASPAEPIFRDWGRTPGSKSIYRITAVDRFGQESPPSQAVRVTLPARELTSLELLPADAERQGLELTDGAAVAGDEYGMLTWRVNVPVAGQYALWTQHRIAQPGAKRGARLTVDDGDSLRYTLYGPYGEDVWWPAQANATTTPHLFELAAGEHKIWLRLDPGVRLTKALLTDDPRRMPAEFGGAPVREETTMTELLEPRGKVLYEESFANLDNWYHEGDGELTLPEPGTMKLQILGSKQGGAGCMAFCRTDFPDHIALEYDLKVLSPNGLVITFVAMKGLHGEDMIQDLPPRTGIFADYVGADAKLKSYHVSVSRYDDNAVHTGVSNWRRNPGLHLMAQGPDLCQEIERWYRTRIVKDGPRVQLQVNGQVAHGFDDPNELPIPLPTDGKIGFRAIGSDVRALVRNLRVVGME